MKEPPKAHYGGVVSMPTRLLLKLRAAIEFTQMKALGGHSLVGYGGVLYSADPASLPAIDRELARRARDN